MKITPFDVALKNGDTIRGHAYCPETEPREAIILSHGFMGSEETVVPYAERLASLGYLAIGYDFRGGGPASKSDGATTDMTVFTEKEDLLAMVQAVREVERIEDITLLGFSQGGFVSALAAAELKSAIHRLAMFYPALCIPDDARSGVMVMARFDPKNIPDTIPCGPMLLGRCYPESVLDMDVNAAIAPYEGPVLIVHGTADGLVNYRYSKAAVQAYKNAALVPIEGADHGFRGEYAEEAIREVEAFLQRT